VGKSATLETPAQLPMLLIVTRMGRDYRLGLLQRIEQVTQWGAKGSLALKISF
jgi:hypothetical protein